MLKKFTYSLNSTVNDRDWSINEQTPHIPQCGELYRYIRKDNCWHSPTNIWINYDDKLLIVGRTDYAPYEILNSLGNLYVLHKSKILLMENFEGFIDQKWVELI